MKKVACDVPGCHVSTTLEREANEFKSLLWRNTAGTTPRGDTQPTEQTAQFEHVCSSCRERIMNCIRSLYQQPKEPAQ